MLVALQCRWSSTTYVALYNVHGSLQCPWFYNIRGCTTSPPKHFDSGKGFKVEYRFNGFSKGQVKVYGQIDNYGQVWVKSLGQVWC